MSKISKLIDDPQNCVAKSKNNENVYIEELLSAFPENADIENVLVKSKAKAKSKEAVNHPAHYQTNNGMEVIDVVEAFQLDFNLGNVVKYVLRCGKKDSDIQDLKKAKWYLDREISNRSPNREQS